MDIKEIVGKLRNLPREGLVRTLYEALPWKERRYFETKIMDPAIRPIRPDMVLIGPAYTVGDPWMALDMLADDSKRGCVIAIATSGCEGTFAGGFMARLAQDDGAVGLLTDGFVTASAGLVKKDFPVFAKGSRIPYAGYSYGGRHQVPISCGGVLVNPGDLVVGDNDGVIVLHPEEAARLCEDAQWIVQVTQTMIAKYLEKGVRFTEVPGVRDYWKYKAEGTRDEAEFYKEWIEKYGQEQST
ncbi:MAG: RraA family protein [Armatimonadetes bacterium]|nr:RraA family protein [Armatimonadota bacterium]